MDADPGIRVALAAAGSSEKRDGARVGERKVGARLDEPVRVAALVPHLRLAAGPASAYRGRPMAYFLQQLINGLTLGAIYVLIPIGYTMVYGIIGMINFAHGEIYMIGA